MVDKSNPWSFEGWNMTAQGAYLRANGQARAEARARDAGTVLGGGKPMPAAMPQGAARRFGDVAIVRPSNPAVYRFMVPHKRDALINPRTVDGDQPRFVDGGNYRSYG